MEYACMMGENIACFNVQRYPEFKSSPLLIAFIYYYLPVRAKNGIALLPWDNSPQRQLAPKTTRPKTTRLHKARSKTTRSTFRRQLAPL